MGGTLLRLRIRGDVATGLEVFLLSSASGGLCLTSAEVSEAYSTPGAAWPLGDC